MTIVDFITARVAEDEERARAAIDPDRPGENWQWVTAETDVPVKPGDEAEALEHQRISLRTIEHFPTQSDLPAFVIESVDEGIPGALRLIADNGPAAALRRCAGVRRAVDAEIANVEGFDAEYGDDCTAEQIRAGQCPGSREGFRHGDIEHSGVLRALASFWSTHPDHQAEWANG